MKKAVLMMAVSIFPRLLVAHDVDVEALAGKTWYGVYLNGQKMGYAEHDLRVAKDGAVEEALDVKLKVNQGGVLQDMAIAETRTYAPDGCLARISSTVTAGGVPQMFEATVEGDSMRCASMVGGRRSEETRPRPAETLGDALSRIRLVTRRPSVGDVLTYSRFECMLKVEIEGTSRVTNVEEQVLDGTAARVYTVETDERFPNETLKSVSRIIEDGTLLEDTIAGIYTMRLEPEQVAKTFDYSSDVIVSNAALIDRPIASPATRESLVLLLEGPLAETHLFTDERQRMVQDGPHVRFEAKRITLDGFTPVSLPIDDEEVKPWLKPSPFIQSDDPRITAKAKEIVGDETDAFRAAATLCAWVNANVRNKYSASLSNALDVLETMEGDCTEHSVLFVALARAAGIPAREAAGLVYTAPDKKPGFYFHQWAAVWVGKWIDMDPMFNQPLVDVTHIKLAEGDLFHQVQLIPIIGRIHVRVIEEANHADL